MLRLSLAFLLLATALAILAGREYAAAAPYAKEPEEIALRTLLRQPARANPHVVLKDFHFTTRFVFMDVWFKSGWRAVWVPVVPPPEPGEPNFDLARRAEAVDGKGPPEKIVLQEAEGSLPRAAPEPGQLRVLIMSESVSDEAGLARLIQQRELRGVVVPAESLHRRDREFLKLKFPQAELPTTLVIKVDETPSGNWLWMLLGLGAGVCLATSVGLFVGWRRQPRKVLTVPAPKPTQVDAAELETWQAIQARQRPPAGA